MSIFMGIVICIYLSVFIAHMIMKLIYPSFLDIMILSTSIKLVDIVEHSELILLDETTKSVVGDSDTSRKIGFLKFLRSRLRELKKSEPAPPSK